MYFYHNFIKKTFRIFLSVPLFNADQFIGLSHCVLYQYHHLRFSFLLFLKVLGILDLYIYCKHIYSFLFLIFIFNKFYLTIFKVFFFLRHDYQFFYKINYSNRLNNYLMIEIYLTMVFNFFNINLVPKTHYWCYYLIYFYLTVNLIINLQIVIHFNFIKFILLIIPFTCYY